MPFKHDHKRSFWQSNEASWRQRRKLNASCGTLGVADNPHHLGFPPEAWELHARNPAQIV
jgi:hypothetical protein